MGCLVLGIVYAVISMLLSGIFEAFHGLHIDGHFEILGIPLSPFTMIVFTTVFGGCGLIFIQLNILAFVIPVFSAIIAYFVAKGFYYLFLIKLRKYEKETSQEDDAIGCNGLVTEAIEPNGGYGKISYSIDNNILSAPCREYGEGGNGIPQNAHVFIIEIKDKVYYVSKENLTNKKEIEKCQQV